MMQNNFLRKLIFDEKLDLLDPSTCYWFICIFIYTVSQTTAYNLEKRGIGTGFDFFKCLQVMTLVISYPFTSKDTHLRAYFVGVLNTLLVSVSGIFLSNYFRFLVGNSSFSNWLFRNIAYVYVEFTRNVPVLLQIILWYSILNSPT